MKKIKVKILEPKEFSIKALNRLFEKCDVERSGNPLKDRDTTEVLFVRLGFKIDKKFLENFPKLRYIVSPTTGEDHIEKEFLKNKNISLISLKGETKFLETVPATAEFTWGLVILTLRNINQSFLSVKKGFWDREAFKGHDLQGKTIALVGFGRVAKKIAIFANTFNMNVKAYDPYVSEFPKYVESCSTMQSLMHDTDILSIHASLNNETNNLIGMDELKQLHPKSIVINTSRGDILDTDALLIALKNKIISGAAIDVIPGELLDKNPIKNKLLDYINTYNNLIITPHLAGATYESMAMTEEFIVEKLLKSIL